MSPWSANPMKFLMKVMSKPSDKSKDQVRFRRERNLVAKNNYHKGGYHTPGRFERKCKLVLPHGGISIKEINEWWELSI